VFESDNALANLPTLKVVVCEVLSVVRVEEGSVTLIAELTDQLIDL
jgi:hypothetical protein